MAASPAPSDPHAAGLGGLIQTQHEHIDLGAHQGRELRARVRRRSIRLALGAGRQLSLELGHQRPVSIEVTRGDTRYDVPVRARKNPWLRLAWRLALLWLASVILVRLVRGRRSTEAAQ
jgi:hypothetical protein